jgi:hypothetical protein
MSGDEYAVLITCLGLGPWAWVRWLYLHCTFARFPQGSSAAWPWMGVVIGNAILLAILILWASWDVRESAVYIAFYWLLGLSLVPLGFLLLHWGGLSWRDDAIERPNPAARLALAGAAVGFFCAYAGANIGDGPGWWVVVFCSALACALLPIGWLILALTLRVDEAITIRRDVATGARVATWFACTGALQGRAVAGDWLSTSATVDDFLRHSTSAATLLVFAAAVEYAARAQRRSADGLGAGTLVAITLMLCFTLLTLVGAGPW